MSAINFIQDGSADRNYSKLFFLAQCGDHVVIINSREIALPGEEWRWRVYFHNTGYAKGKSYTRAWELHDRDPTLVSTCVSVAFFFPCIR